MEQVGKAWFISTLDLLKSSWQVAESQHRILPFGLHGVRDTFQRLMDIVLKALFDLCLLWPTWMMLLSTPSLG